MMIAANKPVGNPMKMEKNMRVDKSSVTKIVTRIKVIIDKSMEITIDFVLFIKKRERKKEKKVLVF